MGEMLNTDTIQQEIEQEKQLSKIDNMNGEVNPYRKCIVNNTRKNKTTNDTYEGIHSDIVSSNRFDENSDISTSYLGRVEKKGSQDKLKPEGSFPISESGYTLGRLLDGTKMPTVIRHRCQ